jgi:hypothetical protein
VRVDGHLDRAGVSNGDEFVVDEVEPDHGGPGVIVEVTADGVAYHLSQAAHVVSFGEYRCT